MIRAILIVFCLLLTACAATIPASYQAQSYVRLGKGEVAISEFSYQPFVEGKVKSNQIHSTAVGQLFIATDISNFVRRATALEIERAGVMLSDIAKYKIEANIRDFTADDLGFSVDWRYSVNYRLINSETEEVLIDKVYASKEVKTGKFGAASDFGPSLNELVLDAIEQFMRDMRETGMFN